MTLELVWHPVDIAKAASENLFMEATGQLTQGRI